MGGPLEMKGDGKTTCRDCGLDYPECTCRPVLEAELQATDALTKAAKRELSKIIAAYNKVWGRK